MKKKDTEKNVNFGIIKILTYMETDLFHETKCVFSDTFETIKMKFYSGKSIFFPSDTSLNSFNLNQLETL